METLFRFCCGVMEVVAVLSGYTYEEVNSMAFVYAEPMLLTLTAALPMLLLVYKLWRKRTPQRFALLAAATVWLLPFAFGMLKLWQRYGGSLQDAFREMHADLAALGEATGLGFVNITLLLFIVAFLFFFLLNIFLYTLLRNVVLDAPKPKARKKTKKSSK